MKSKMIFLVVALCATGLRTAIAVPGKDSSEYKYSNIGLKLTLGLGTRDVPSSQDLERGDAASLSLGYGVSQRVTLWLGMNTSKHVHELDPERESDIVGIELGAQYKLRPNQRLRPYGTFGIGTVFLGSEGKKVLNGGGVMWALGVEYYLLRFLSVGAEFFWKDMEYTKQGENGVDGDFTKLDRPINADTRGFMINFTLH